MPTDPTPEPERPLPECPDCYRLLADCRCAEPERQREPSPEAVALWRFFWARCQNLYTDRRPRPPLALVDDAPKDDPAVWHAEEALCAAREQGRREQSAKSCSCICHEDGRAILEQGRREGLEEAARFLGWPVMVFAFKSEDIRADVIRRVRALAAQPQAEKEPKTEEPKG